METRKRIYLAGPYSANNIAQVLRNMRTGIHVASNIMKDGYAVFCPFIDYQFQFFNELSIEDYYEYSLAFLRVCEEIWVLPNSENSVGTQNEIIKANQWGIPIKDVPEKYFEKVIR